MRKDTCVRAGTYCPVCRGCVLADCWHDASEFLVIPKRDNQVALSTARTEGERAGMERAAEIADAEYKEHEELSKAHLDEERQSRCQARARTAFRIATAIRTAGDAPPRAPQQPTTDWLSEHGALSEDDLDLDGAP